MTLVWRTLMSEGFFCLNATGPGAGKKQLVYLLSRPLPTASMKISTYTWVSSCAGCGTQDQSLQPGAVFAQVNVTRIVPYQKGANFWAKLFNSLSFEKFCIWLHAIGLIFEVLIKFLLHLLDKLSQQSTFEM